MAQEIEEVFDDERQTERRSHLIDGHRFSVKG